MDKNRKNFKILRKIAIFIAILTIFTVFAASDISAGDYENHWAKNVFEDWVRTGILVPDQYGNIYPDSLITRGQLCSYINRVMGFATMADVSQYADTQYGSQYYNDMAVAVYAGYISPTSATTLSPSSYMTRGQVIDAFVKVAKVSPLPGDEAILSQVRDASDIPAVNRGTVSAAIMNGFLAGRPGYMVEPNDFMTVSEAVVLLDRINSSRRVYAFPGTFGPDAGSVISSYSSILAPGIKLQNADVARDLEIQQETGEGEVNLSGVNVREKLLVNGGKNIYLENNNIKEIQVNKRGANLIYTENGNSEADTLIINGDNVTVDIKKGNKTRKIVINGNNVTVNLGENVKIEELTGNGADARVNLDKGARIDSVELNAKTQILGREGSVGDLTVNEGGGGSEIEPRPGGKVNTASGADVTIDNRPSGSIGSAKRIISISFETPFTMIVTTEDVGKTIIERNDFRIDVDGASTDDFTVSKSSPTQFNIIFSSEVSASSQVTVSGTGNLTGSANLSRDSQAAIVDAVATNLRTVNVTVTSPANKALSKDSFKLQIGGKDSDAFTLTALSLTSYNLNLAADIKNGQILTISGKNELTGSITVSAISAIKSLVFNDTDKITVNTDNTAGNKIDNSSFDIFINDSPVDFTVSEKSKTAYQITLSSDFGVGDTVRAEGKKYLTGRLESQYVSPFKVSKVTVTGRTNINIVLTSAPDVILSTDRHAGAFQVLVDDLDIPVGGVTKDASDTKNTSYNLTVNLDGAQGILSVNGIKESKNKGMVDYVPPELVSVRMNDQPLTQASPNFRTEQSKAKLIIEFTEPVFKTAPSGKFSNKDVDVSGAAFNIISGNGGGIDLNGNKVTASGNSITIDLEKVKRMDPGVYTLSISSVRIFDAMGNVCSVPENNSFRFEIKGTLPSVTSAKQAVSGDIEIKLNGTYADNFGNAMSENGTALIIDPTDPSSNGRSVASRLMSYDAKSKILFISRAALPPGQDDPNNPDHLSGNIPYRIELYNRDYTRAAGQIVPASENPLVISRVTIDTQRPRIEKITLDGEVLFDKDNGFAQKTVKSSKSNAVIQILFSKPVFEQPPAKKFSSIDTYGQPFNIDTADPLAPGDSLSLQGVRVATSNRTISIPLKSAQRLDPGEYKLIIDPSLIFDAVGNTVDVSDFRNSPGFPNLTCYFNIVNVPPRINSVSQTASGDIQIRFTRYYTWALNPYGVDICGNEENYGMGILKILDLSRPEGQQQIGNDITSEYLTWDRTGYTITIDRRAIPENLDGSYAIGIDCPDYDTIITPKIRISSNKNNDPAVTLGGDKNIPVNPNADQARIIPDDAIIKIAFPIPVTFSKDYYLDLTGDISSYPFSVYSETGTIINKDAIKFTHNGGQILIDLSKAVTEDMINIRFTLAINQTLINSSGGQVGNKISLYGFTLAKPPLPAIEAKQVEETGDIQIEFKGIVDDIGESQKAHDYINLICGENGGVGSSTVRIERRGEVIGEIPAHVINGGGVTRIGIAPQVIKITRAALESITDSEGRRVYLDAEGGQYTIVLNHSSYADNPVRCTIDTTPPAHERENFKAKVEGRTVSLWFTFNKKEAKVPDEICTLTGPTGGTSLITPEYLPSNNKTIIEVTFTMASGTSPSDYNIKFTVIDKFGNVSEQIDCNPVITSQPSAAQESVNGLTNFYNGSTKIVSNSALIPAIAAMTPEYDGAIPAPVVMIQSEMTVTAPTGSGKVESCRYAVSKDMYLWDTSDFEYAVSFESATQTAVLNNTVKFSAPNVTQSTMENSTETSRTGWTWTVEETHCYYILEWTMEDGSVIYTYVYSDISGK